ncbi:MFS transporter [Gordonia sp. SID5947]|uniref:MFS transporter n=1 Tax=Gordonia sp. SID5947 TaxID=2690315 RepID=UPI001368BC22|nr:MFS transporter [Gordonia sp. SID5947]MYR07744.1 MFS transporter [Gordonia sp. SID5947]
MDHSITQHRGEPTSIAPPPPEQEARRDGLRRGRLPAPVVGGRRAWMITGLLMVLMMINFADKAVLGLSATSIREEFGITAEQYGTISSAFFLLFSIAALVVGHLADRFSTSKVLFVLALIWSVSMLPVIGPAGFTVLLVSRIVLGAAEGPAFGVAQHALHKWFEDADRSIPTALLTIATSVGIIVGAPALSWMIVNHGWRSAFILVAVIGLVWSAVWLVVGREGPVDVHSSSARSQFTRPIDRMHVPLWQILVSPTWLGCALSSFAAYWSVSLLIAWLPAFLTDDLGYSKTETGFIATLPWIVAVITLLVQGLAVQRLMHNGVSSRLARGVLPGIILLASGVCTLGFVYVPESGFTIVLVALGLGLSGAVFAAATTVCGEIAPIGQRGAVLGAFVAVYSLAGVIAPFVAGVFVGSAEDATDTGYSQVFGLTGLIVIVGGVLAVTLIRPERDKARLAAAGRTIN